MKVLGYSGFTREVTSDGHGDRVSPFARTGLRPESLFEFHAGEAPFQLFPLGFFGHDASACLVVDGRVVACAAEERFTRCKHAINLAGNTLLPGRAVRWCLDAANLTADDLDAVAFYCDFRASDIGERGELLAPHLPAATLKRLLATYADTYRSMLGLSTVTAQYRQLTGSAPASFIPVRHHLAHAASAFYPSGFENALIMTIDGTGELESSMLAVGSRGRIEPISDVPLPTSLGALYLVLTIYLGFHGLGDEFKVMGLAAYGDRQRYRRLFDELVILADEGRYSTPALVSPRLRELLLAELGPPRRADEPITSRHADAAAGLQDALERAVLHTLAHARHQTGQPRLCLAGGVALNCSLNGRIARSGLFDEIFVQPAASDEGGSLGAALYAWHALTNGALTEGALTDDVVTDDAMTSGAATSGAVTSGAVTSGAVTPASVTRTATRCEHVFFGPVFDDHDIANTLMSFASQITWREVAELTDIADVAATELSRGKVIGWFQGAMEFGPRALGHRSILADPRDAATKDRVNELVKHREPFRPFAPAVIEEEAAAWFDLTGLGESPYMLFAVPVQREVRARIPAVTHVDGTARVQTVSRRVDPLFHRLIYQFGELTGVPVVLNTSFNVNREPIVCSPNDAIRCFLGTDIDGLCIGRYFVTKRD